MVDIKEMKEKRLELKLTQIELARMVGVTGNTYRNWELGANKPSNENLDKLMEVLDMEKTD